MKILNKIATAVVSGSIALCAMSAVGINASADSWSVYFYPAQAPNGLKLTAQNNFTSNSTITYFYDSSSSFQQTSNYMGYPAHVEYWGYCADNSGNVVHMCTNSNFAYYSTASKTKRSLSSGCGVYYVFVVKHEITTNGNNCSMSGSVSLT